MVDIILLDNVLYLIASEKNDVAKDYEKIISHKVHQLDTKELSSNESLREALKEKGISLLYSSLNFTTKVLFTYSLEHLKSKDKVRFYYALKGRDGKSGILKEIESQQMGRAVILVNELHETEFTDFMTLWKCPFTKMRVMVEDKHVSK